MSLLNQLEESSIDLMDDVLDKKEEAVPQPQSQVEPQLLSEHEPEPEPESKPQPQTEPQPLSDHGPEHEPEPEPDPKQKVEVVVDIPPMVDLEEIDLMQRPESKRSARIAAMNEKEQKALNTLTKFMNSHPIHSNKVIDAQKPQLPPRASMSLSVSSTSQAFKDPTSSSYSYYTETMGSQSDDHKEESPKSQKTSNFKIVAMVVTLVIIVILILALIIFIVRSKRKSKLEQAQTVPPPSQQQSMPIIRQISQPLPPQVQVQVETNRAETDSQTQDNTDYEREFSKDSLNIDADTESVTEQQIDVRECNDTSNMDDVD